MEKLESLATSDTVVVLGGKEYHLRYSFKALRLIEEKFGSLDVLDNLEGRYFSHTLFLLYAGLVSKHPEITVEEVERLLDEEENLPEKLKEISEKIAEAVQKSFPEAKEGGQKKEVATEVTKS